jgi:hypothetical protein
LEKENRRKLWERRKVKAYWREWWSKKRIYCKSVWSWSWGWELKGKRNKSPFTVFLLTSDSLTLHVIHMYICTYICTYNRGKVGFLPRLYPYYYISVALEENEEGLRLEGAKEYLL